MLVRAEVDEILFDDSTGATQGVRMVSGQDIVARRGVISSAGYMTTFNKLVPENITTRFSVPRTLPFGQSAGFVMVNIGLRGTAQKLGITNTNLWYHPVDGSGDIIPPLQRYIYI